MYVAGPELDRVPIKPSFILAEVPIFSRIMIDGNLMAKSSFWTEFSLGKLLPS
jgi:hypothetical protein